MFVSKHVYLTDMKADRIDWNKGNNVFAFALAFPPLNHLRVHIECTFFLCPSMHVWSRR